MTPWSVSPSAGIPSSAQRATRASILQAPSSSEYSEWTWRWTAAGLLTSSSLSRAADAKTALIALIARDLRAILVSALPVAAAGAAVPEVGGELVLLPLGGELRSLEPAAEALVGLGQHLVGATGAARRVERVVVAAGLAPHDRLRDRVIAEPPADRLAGVAALAGRRLERTGLR